METVSGVVTDIGETFKGIFTGGASFSEMSTGKKLFVVFIAGLVVLLILGLIYYIYTHASAPFGAGSTRGVGPAGCCGRLQNVRSQIFDTVLSDQDLQQAENARIIAGSPYQRNMFPGSFEEGAGPLGIYDNTMGFTARAKPTANDISATAESPCCGNPMVRPQVPYGDNIRPNYSESDYVNMAYSA